MFTKGFFPAYPLLPLYKNCRARSPNHMLIELNKMTNIPLISIVTVTLNCREAAVPTAESVLNQEMTNIQYVVKDGGSVDGTPEKLMSLGAEVLCCPDKGIYDAMNQAIPLCRGKYIYFLNADDILFSNKTIKDVAEFIETRKFPRFLFGNIRTFGEHPFVKSPYRDVCYPNKIHKLFMFRQSVYHQAWFIDLDLLKECGGFDTQYKICADYDMFLKMFIRDKLKNYEHIPQILSCYDGKGYSIKNVARLYQEKEAIRRKYFTSSEILYFSKIQSVLSACRRVIYRTYRYLPIPVKNRLNSF